MLGKEQMQTITVDGDAQETWLSKVRRFHTEVKLLVVDTAGQQYTLIEIKKETAKWHYIESCASKFILTSKSMRKTIWPCHYGPTLALHIRVDERGQLEVWSGSVPVAKYFDSHATPEEWSYGFFHVSASIVINLAALLLCDHTVTLRSLDLSGAEKIFDLQPLENFTELGSLDISFCCEIIDIRSLAILNKLTSLSMYGCHKVSDIRPLARLLDLRSLILSHCSEIINISPSEK